MSTFAQDLLSLAETYPVLRAALEQYVEDVARALAELPQEARPEREEAP
jgi:hypothetical protein